MSLLLSQILDKRPAPPSPPAESVPAPPPTPDHSSVAPTPVPDPDNLHPCPAFDPDSIARSQSANRSSDEKSSSRERTPFLARFTPTLVLENSGSVARDHLASERTFLAYVRTSLTIATAGVALVQLFTVAFNTDTTATGVSSAVTRIQQYARPLGATLVAFGLAVLAFGVRRYFAIQASLTRGVFPITRFGIAGVTIILAVIVIVVFAVLVSGRS